MTSNSRAEGRFSKLDFIYIAKDDEYLCPAGERLRWHQTTNADACPSAMPDREVIAHPLLEFTAARPGDLGRVTRSPSPIERPAHGPS
jgi:hypothetical protein